MTTTELCPGSGSVVPHTPALQFLRAEEGQLVGSAPCAGCDTRVLVKRPQYRGGREQSIWRYVDHSGV